MLRSTGISCDVRKNFPYDIYDRLDFNIVTSHNGDCYDRYLIRLNEMRESLHLMNQVINKMPAGFCQIQDRKIFPPLRIVMKRSMEALIHHFKLYTEGYSLVKNKSYMGVEAPKGEFGIFIVSNGDNRPYRCKIKAPGFSHLQSINSMSYNHLIADIVTIIGTQDIVFGEVDR
jgi:NADH:ubiquinone oxidoreductase subunit D